MEHLNDLFDEFDEQLHAPERAATERKLQQEAETKRPFDVGRDNLHSLVVPVVETLVAEVEARGHELRFVENNVGNRPMVAVTFRAKREGVFLSSAVSSLVFESWGLSLYSPNSQILNLPSNSTPQYLSNSEHHCQADVRRAVVHFIKDVLKTLQTQ